MPSGNGIQTSAEGSAGEAHLIYRGGYRAEYMASDSDNKDPSAVPTDVAGALLARDYKGISNYPSNVVIEVYEIK